MAALAEVEEGLARSTAKGSMMPALRKKNALTASIRSNLTFDDGRELREVCGAYHAAVGGVAELRDVGRAR